MHQPDFTAHFPLTVEGHGSTHADVGCPVKSCTHHTERPGKTSHVRPRSKSAGLWMRDMDYKGPMFGLKKSTEDHDKRDTEEVKVPTNCKHCGVPVRVDLHSTCELASPVRVKVLTLARHATERALENLNNDLVRHSKWKKQNIKRVQSMAALSKMVARVMGKDAELA